MSEKTLRVATDVGGTFTDLVAFETDTATGRSRVVTAKTDTTPPNFEAGVLNVLAKGGIDPSAIDFLAHGTTVVINALTERKGGKVGLVTTLGFRDSLEIARGNRPDFFNLYYQKPPVFVPRHLRRELPGRMTYKGLETEPLDLAPLAAIVADFKAEGVEAGGHLLPAFLCQSGARAGGAGRDRPALAGGGHGLLASDQPRVARIRAHQHGGDVGLRPADRRTVSEAAGLGPRRARFRR